MHCTQKLDRCSCNTFTPTTSCVNITIKQTLMMRFYVSTGRLSHKGSWRALEFPVKLTVPELVKGVCQSVRGLVSELMETHRDLNGPPMAAYGFGEISRCQSGRPAWGQVPPTRYPHGAQWCPGRLGFRGTSIRRGITIFNPPKIKHAFTQSSW